MDIVNSKKPVLVLFPGLGADERLFKYLDNCGLDTIKIKYPAPSGNETVPEYASRLMDQIPKDIPLIFTGVSLGGVLSQVLSELVPNCRGMVLISTVKGSHELSRWLRIFSRVKPLFNPWLIRHSLVVIRWFIGSGSRESYQVFKDMLYETPPDLIKWGARTVPKWEGCEVKVPYFHIHGDKDHLFPVSKIKDPLVIKGGKHFMVFNHASHVNPVFRGCVDRLIRQIQ